MELSALSMHRSPLTSFDKKARTDNGLLAACRDFEAIMIQQMFKSMRRTVQASDFIPNSMAQDIFEGMLDEEIAFQMARYDGLGLAAILHEQLSE